MPRRDNDQTAGCLIGCGVSALLWMWPIPVLLIVKAFGLTGLFSDTMYLFAPFLIIFPLLGACVGLRINGPHEPER